MSQGKGISDAVRGIAPKWFDNETTEKVAKAAKLSYLEQMRLRTGDNWTRCRTAGRRRAIDSKGGWVRKYYCKGVAEDKVNLVIRCNEEETKIVYFTITAGGKTIDGGVSNVASVFQSGKNNQARVAVAGSTKNEAEEEFRRFSAAELQRMQTEIEFDDLADLLSVRED